MFWDVTLYQSVNWSRRCGRIAVPLSWLSNFPKKIIGLFDPKDATWGTILPFQCILHNNASRPLRTARGCKSSAREGSAVYRLPQGSPKLTRPRPISPTRTSAIHELSLSFLRALVKFGKATIGFMFVCPSVWNKSMMHVHKNMKLMSHLTNSLYYYIMC
jgi:hypothetical protein